MLIDDVVAQAKVECEKFLAPNAMTDKERGAAFSSLLHTVERVLAAANMSVAMFSSPSVALEIYKAHREYGPLRQEVRISVLQKGGMVKEDKVTCPDGCHVYASQIYKVSVEEVMKAGIPVTLLAKGIADFLKDPNKSMLNLTGSLKN